MFTSSPPGFTLLVASGPFTTNDNFKYEPLMDLLQVVKRDKPSVLVLVRMLCWISPLAQQHNLRIISVQRHQVVIQWQQDNGH